jgi:hypothetical protein
MVRDIDVLNEEMEAAGARFFAGGLAAAGSAKSLRAQPDGKVRVTDGPYLETKEHIGGFWIVNAAKHGRGSGVGPQGCHRLSGARRGARVPLTSDEAKKWAAVDFRSPERLAL